MYRCRAASRVAVSSTRICSSVAFGTVRLVAKYPGSASSSGKPVAFRQKIFILNVSKSNLHQRSSF